MNRPGPMVALLALLSAPALAEHSPAAEIPSDLMSAVTKARYAVRFETEAKIPAVSNYAQDLRARFGDEGSYRLKRQDFGVRQLAAAFLESHASSVR